MTRQHGVKMLPKAKQALLSGRSCGMVRDIHMRLKRNDNTAGSK